MSLGMDVDNNCFVCGTGNASTWICEKCISKNRIAVAIGATRVVHVTDKKIGTPLSWLNLAHKLKNRLVSNDGTKNENQQRDSRSP
jgi:hypothetical protein